MCGILGGINIEPEKLRQALPLLIHRGPDERGEAGYENVTLFHVRLSIQDIKSGQQPFEHGNYIIVYNGEIYNHLELRKRHKLECRTKSDTETLIRLYEKLGPEAFNEVDGMFACVILEKTKRLISIFRDRAGKKPIYYMFQNKKFVFGSELNSLKAAEFLSIDHDKIFQYLRYSFTGSSTPYKNVLELEAGCYIQINIDTLEYHIEKWWSIIDFYKIYSNLKLGETIEHLDYLLNKSILARIRASDLEVGAFLSGGIDSGLVTSIASKYLKNLKTFTVSFDKQYDESLLAEKVAKKYGTHHIKLRISYTDLAQDLEKILANYGEPFADSSAIPSYYVSREARKHLTVILNGDGADELFCGYRRYVPFAYFDFFKNRPLIKKSFNLLSSVLPFPDEKMSLYNYFFRLCDLAGKSPLLSYLSSTFDSFEGFEKNFTSAINPFQEMGDFLGRLNNENLSGLRKIMSMDFQYFFPNDLLVKIDIATMANSLEGRSPFLSHEIMEFAPTINDKFKIKGVTTKYVLRELGRRYLPDEIIRQPKRGFEVPLKQWIDHDLKEIVYDYLSGKTISEQYVNRTFISDLLNKKIAVPPEKRAKMLWVLLALEIWYKRCFLQINPVK